MPYITPMQIAIVDELAARLGIDDPDGWVREQPMFASEPPVQGVADLTDKDAALLILMWRRELEARMQQGIKDAPKQPARRGKKTPG